MKDYNQPLNIAIIFIWIGFVCAISFMEAWLKFQAPDITIILGLGIGKLVFSALNKVELVFASLILLRLFYPMIYNRKPNISKVFFGVVLILLIQTFWLLPALVERINLVIEGRSVSESNLHLLYIALEIIKVIGLFTYGVKLLKIKNGNKQRKFSEHYCCS